MWGASFILAAMLAQPQFKAAPCPAALAADASVTCGSVAVPEDRRRPERRTIALNVIVLAALTDRPDLPPLVDIDGGPGLASTRSADFYRGDGRAYRRRRAVILVDQRGTGGSNPLTCPALVAPEARLQPLYPTAAVTACRRALARRADPAHYGTTEAAADLDVVRAALGHRQLDIVAISYGTTLALRYMAEFPGRVRAAVLSGVVPAAAMPPRDHAVVAQKALLQVFADCAAVPACHAAYPDLAEALRRAVSEVATGPSPVTAPVFLEKLRTMLYQPVTARVVPKLIQAAAAGDFKPFLALAGGTGPASGSDGLYLSVTCAESMARMDYAAAAAAARRTIFGDYRLSRQRAACRSWPRTTLPAGFFAPARSDAAILLISGGRDPVTPAAWAEAAARTLPRARHIVIPWSGHGFEGLGAVDTCYDPLLLGFFDTGDADGIDPACTQQMLPPPFVLPGS